MPTSTGVAPQTASEAQLVKLGILWGIALSIVFVFTYYWVTSQPKIESSTVAIELLKVYLTPGYSAQLDNEIFYKTFQELEFSSFSAGESDVEKAFDSVFRSYGNFSSYSIDTVTERFVIVRLYDLNGELTPPPVGFWFSLNDRNKIVDWKITRLQPFSKYDDEFLEGLS